MLDYIEQVAHDLKQRHWMMVAAESCTAGMICAAITERAGSSAYFDRGFVTYSNESKTDLLGVPAELIIEHGAVSAPVAELMAKGALQKSKAHIAVAVTGIAGPSGGTQEKPVGTVYIAVMDRSCVLHVKCHHFHGDRASIRKQTVREACVALVQLMESSRV